MIGGFLNLLLLGTVSLRDFTALGCAALAVMIAGLVQWAIVYERHTRSLFYRSAWVFLWGLFFMAIADVAYEILVAIGRLHG